MAMTFWTFLFFRTRRNLGETRKFDCRRIDFRETVGLGRIWLVIGVVFLSTAGVTNLEDLGHEVPGLTVVSGGPGQNQITLRGLSGNNTVGLYVDDTPVSVLNAQVAPNNWFMDPAMFDLQRVEVLKGPEGTLYGASSLAGTVRYITASPPDGSRPGG
jgi:iron complex outermembrane recepter protein